ncbi:MAG: hypothetical protein Q9195_006219 [Heterodermia aff. obscurata]
MAMSVIFGCVGIEKFYIPEFIMRHSRRMAFMRDETQRQLNTWVTEVHVNYYSIVRKSNTRFDAPDFEQHQPNSDSDMDPEDATESSDPSLFPEGLRPCPGRPDWGIRRSIISFHFIGDLNDRYWTSHVFADVSNDWGWFTGKDAFDLTKPSGHGDKNKFHSQRKIMEADWFTGTLAHVVDETKYILSYVSEVINNNDHNSKNSSRYDTFQETFERNKKTYSLYGDLIKFLFDVKQSLVTTRRTAKEWEDRPKYREVQPRWMEDDEAAYHEEILHWTYKAQFHLLTIRSLLERIESEIDYVKQLRQWLLDDLSLKEARISNRSADDVRIFTYATVIFLPLSFASGIFSMSGAPDRATVQPFIVAAVVALVATIVFLLNAGTPIRNITYFKNQFLKLPQDDSILEHAESQWKAVFKALYSYLLIWPARRVLTARDILARRGKRHKQRKRIDTAKDRPSSARSIGGKMTAPHKQEKVISDERSRREQRRIELTEKLRRHQHQQETTKVVVGLILLPMFLLSIIFRFIGQNVFDLAKFLLITLPHYQDRRIKHEVSKIEDDRESIKSDNKASANQMKNSKNNETITEEQEIREDEKRQVENFHRSNLKRFIQTPRFKDLGQYLQEGRTWDEARKEMKGERKKANAEFKTTKRDYKRVRNSIIRRVANVDDKIADIDLGIDLSSDDGSETRKNPSDLSSDDNSENRKNSRDGHATHRLGFSMPRLFRRRHGRTEQQERDSEKAGDKVLDDDVERARRGSNRTIRD